MWQWIREHRGWVGAGGAVAAAGIVFVLVWFQPQKLFIDERVDETLPGAVATTTGDSIAADDGSMDDGSMDDGVMDDDSVDGGTAAGDTDSDEAPGSASGEAPEGSASTPTTTSTTTTTTTPPGPIVLHESALIDVGHAGTGDVLVVELPDGTRIVRFEDLDVENGPDLRVILSRSPLVEDRNAYDDGDFVDLGSLKGNQGNQNYEVPGGVSLDGYQTVAIWCRRFNYTFNAATIASS